jgi:hypothetical protein
VVVASAAAVVVSAAAVVASAGSVVASAAAVVVSAAAVVASAVTVSAATVVASCVEVVPAPTLSEIDVYTALFPHEYFISIFLIVTGRYLFYTSLRSFSPGGE